MKVETEENQQDPSHHKCTAAYELKKVEAFARGALHDGLNADECNQGQNLARKLEIQVRVYLVHIYGHACLLYELNSIQQQGSPLQRAVWLIETQLAL